MNRYFMPAALVAAGALALPGAATAAPKLKTSPSFEGSRLVVTVTSGKKFTSRTRPRGVKVATGGATYKLQQGARSARKSKWRSGALSSSQLAALSAAKVRITVKTASGTVKQTRTAPAVSGDGGSNGPGAPPTPTGGTAPPAAPGVTLTRDDAAAKAALGSGDLLLERMTAGSVTQTYYRIFLYANGVFRYQQADWNSVSGEICDSSARREGTWSFAEGYTFPERGGGVAVVINTVVNGQSARELLIWGNADPNAVYVGTQGIRFDINPHMRDQC